MATLRDIQTRIKSVRQIQKITAAMKMVAAARLRKLQQSQEAFQPFSTSLEALYGPLRAVVESGNHPFIRKEEGRGNTWVIILTSERGLCGAYNHNTEHAARKFIRQNGGETVTLLVAGRKGLSRFRGDQFRFLDFEWPEGAYLRAKSLSFLLQRAYLSGEAGEVYLVYNRLQLNRERGIKIARILPLTGSELSGERPSPPVRLSSCVMEPGVDGVFNQLAGLVIFYRLHACLLDASAGEELGRMNAMEQATENADDLIFNLTLAFNKARQEAITMELMDILGGAQLD